MTGMTDREIVERLRHPMQIAHIEFDGTIEYRASQPSLDDIEAANAIERLIKERDEALGALRKMIWFDEASLSEATPEVWAPIAKQARSILSKYEAKP